MMIHYMPNRNTEKRQAGFTIVELMVATAVFSLVLVVILYGVLSFSHAYYSGVNSTAIQNTARSITNSVSQAIEFSGNEITPVTNISGSTNYFCVGGATYYYAVGAMYDGASPSAADPGLYMIPGICSNTPSIPAAGGKELLGTDMRITYLDVSQSSANMQLTSPRLYNVALGLTFGQSDLLCNISKNGSGNKGDCLKNTSQYSQGVAVTGTGPNDVVCRLVTGYEFCAHAGLSTTVSLRVDNSDLAP
jgi:prepilin-type N-terminal cleavage/methylation domain-containing protein